jgi:hypothetical protein
MTVTDVKQTKIAAEAKGFDHCSDPRTNSHMPMHTAGKAPKQKLVGPLVLERANKRPAKSELMKAHLDWLGMLRVNRRVGARKSESKVISGCDCACMLVLEQAVRTNRVARTTALSGLTNVGLAHTDPIAEKKQAPNIARKWPCETSH